MKGIQMMKKLKRTQLMKRKETIRRRNQMKRIQFRKIEFVSNPDLRKIQGDSAVFQSQAELRGCRHWSPCIERGRTG